MNIVEFNTSLDFMFSPCLQPRLSSCLSPMKSEIVKKKLKITSLSKTNHGSSIGTSVPIQVENENEDIALVPIDIEEDDYNDSAVNTISKPRERSWVWPHYTRFMTIEKRIVNGKMTEVEQEKAKCKYCTIAPYKIGSSGYGTTTLRRHLKDKCVGYKRLQGKGQTVITGDKTLKNKMTIRSFNQDDIIHVLIEMIVVDEMPFSTVDKPGFRKFCSVAIPEFMIPSRRVFVKNFFKMYEVRKNLLRQELTTHSVSLTTDTWTSVQNTNYMVITTHFIDSEWTMHKIILSFSQIENHQGVTIGKAIEECLLNWKIEKVLTITVDNASANKSALDWLKGRMDRWENSKAIMSGQYLHVRCTAHIVNLIVGHGLKVLNKSVLAIRNAISYVRSSPHRKLEFKRVADVVKIPHKGLVVLDVPTRWNSTYLMLESALNFKKAFERMEEDDGVYRAYFDNEEVFQDFNNPDDELIAPAKTRKRVGPPHALDWEKATAFVDFLELFYEVTLRVSSSLRPTAHTCFHDIMLIESKLREIYVPITDHTTQKRTPLEEVLSTMSEKMTAKYEKYFGRHEEINQLLLIALFLDPRFKMTSVAHVLAKDGVDEIEVKKRTDELLTLVKKIYDCYKPLETIPPSQSPNNHSSLTSIGTSKTTSTKKRNLIYLLGDLPVVDDNLVPKHEVDKYLSDRLEILDLNSGNEFDILCWWKYNEPKYPVLGVMAKDVLAIQVSSVASESAFSTGGRIIDCSRSSLTPKSVEALICLQDWLKGNDIVTYIKDEPSIEAYTFYE